MSVSLSRRDVLWQLSLVALAPRFALGGVSAEPSFSMEFDTASGDPFPGTERLIAETLLYLS